MSNYVNAWHFVGKTLRDGRPIPLLRGLNQYEEDTFYEKVCDHCVSAYEELCDQGY